MRDEQQEAATADLDSEAVSLPVLEDSLVEKLAGVQVIRRVTSFHSTPLPDAETLGANAEPTRATVTPCDVQEPRRSAIHSGAADDASLSRFVDSMEGTEHRLHRIVSRIRLRH